jgi:hypothetical protein
MGCRCVRAQWARMRGQSEVSSRAKCPSCEFAFDVSLVLEEVIVDDGSCGKRAQDLSFVYAYSASYSALMVGYGGSYYPLAPATFSASELVYAGGPEDELVEGYYVTDRVTGSATVK